MNRLFPILIFILLFNETNAIAGGDSLRVMRYTSRPAGDVKIWQEKVRSQLLSLLKLDDQLAGRINMALNPVLISKEEKGSYQLSEVEFNSTPGRRIRVIVTLPNTSQGSWPAVVCIHGHQGKIRSVYDKSSIYKGFADTLASTGYVTIAPVVSQHTVSEDGRTLMGERLWDLIRCIDYLETLPGVNKNRIGCAGLSLGGEMTMWLGAMDVRIKAAVSSGFLTRMDQMEHNHCMCWKFAGLRQLVDFADIYALAAPRAMQCQNGLKEPKDMFYVPLAREAFKEIEATYRDLGKPGNLAFDVHDGGHEIDLPGLLAFLGKFLGAE